MRGVCWAGYMYSSLFYRLGPRSRSRKSDSPECFKGWGILEDLISCQLRFGKRCLTLWAFGQVAGAFGFAIATTNQRRPWPVKAVAKPTGQSKNNDQKTPKRNGPKALPKLALAQGHKHNQEKIEQCTCKDPGDEIGLGKLEWFRFKKGNETIKRIRKTLGKGWAIFVKVMNGRYRLDRKSCLNVHFSIGSKVFEDLMDFAIGAKEFWVNKLPALRAGKGAGANPIG